MRLFYILLFFILSAGSIKAQTVPGRSGSLADAETKVLKFYPNPAVSQITFDFEKGFDKNYSLQIFSFIGKKVFEAQSVNSSTVVNVSDFFRGVYIFQVRDKAGRIIEAGKFQVAR